MNVKKILTFDMIKVLKCLGHPQTKFASCGTANSKVKVIDMKVKELIKHRKGMISFAALAGEAAAGYVFSGASMRGTSAFADISIAGAAGLAGSAAVFLGSLLRCFADDSIGRNIVKLAAMVMIIIVKLLMDNKRSPLSCGIYTAVSVVLSGAAVSAVIGELVYKFLFYLFYSASAGFTSYSICRIVRDAEKGKAIVITASTGCYYAVVYTIYAASLCSAKLPLINIGAVLGIALTMLASYYYGSTGGVICGALTVCAAFLSSSDTGMTVVLLPAAGLFSGFIRQCRIAVSALIFMGISFMLAVLTGMTDDIIYSMAEHFAGAGVFFISTSCFSDKRVRVPQSLPWREESVKARLDFMSDSLATLRKDTQQLAEKLMKKKSSSREKRDDTKKVCGRCYRKHICRRQGSTTMKGLAALAEMSEISLETFPAELDTCIRRNELIASRQKGINDETLEKLMDMRKSDCRGMLSEQFSIIEDMVRTSGREGELSYSAPLSTAIREKLTKFGFEPEYVSACYNSKGRLLAEIYFSAKDAPASSTRICDLISDELRMKLICSDPVSSGNEVRLRLCEKPPLNLEVCTASRKAVEDEESGDTFMIFGDGTGTGYIVLSDGMGSGKDAAFESSLAAGLFRRLICSGTDCQAAVRMINSIMFSKSREEAFATLDILIADLDSGELTSLKSGAAATMVRHGGNVIRLSSDAFPVGMYEEADVTKTVCGFEEGDVAIMFSDGICEGEYRFIRELLLGGNDLKSIVDEICAKSEKFSPFNRADDVTVIGVRVVSA